ncbi:LysR family transcriptional regulator [Rhizobium sp. SSA_523]|uniref:LysR family transcriptional regulator n=1 Tax=Rhizobium sp. SSA_523 TaxID=2952477 RepID=UPI0020916272|nr:LysR family transcriptional regulator [Rhizobium sp. SSA_523]MCO5734846.1 LysR family transcriptional regulator [Rhizobium sp. SSA_523]WKC21818.1 LysR family transcriptional regulator [Rhizobium sp. SSA_523]
MDHWDELRMFLAVAKGGTVRAAADALDLNHATVLRGVARLELRLKTKLFERLPSGYRLTSAGADIVDLAAQMSEASTKIEAKIFARDQSVSGPLRLTLPVSFATDLLMETLTEFRSTYPDIALEIIGTGTVANLSNREADVALRVVLGKGSPPENLYGSRLCGFHMAYYGCRDRLGNVLSPLAWLLGPGELIPGDWVPEEIDMAATPVRFSEMRSKLHAARAGMGITLLPCFVGDADLSLSRVPGSPIIHAGDVWLLTHVDTRQTLRVRLLCDRIRASMRGVSAMVEGRTDRVTFDHDDLEEGAEGQ